LVVIIVLLIFVLPIWLISGKFSIIVYIDIPTLTFVGLLPYCIMWVLFGNSKTKKIISVPFLKNQTDEILNESLLFFKMFNILIWCSALLFMIINFIDLLFSLSGNKASELNIWIHLALTLLSPLYAILLNLLFIIPYIIIIKMKIK
jgi:hypothetical protein